MFAYNKNNVLPGEKLYFMLHKNYYQYILQKRLCNLHLLKYLSIFTRDGGGVCLV